MRNVLLVVLGVGLLLGGCSSFGNYDWTRLYDACQGQDHAWIAGYIQDYLNDRADGMPINDAYALEMRYCGIAPVCSGCLSEIANQVYGQ